MDALLLYDCYPGAQSVAQMKSQRALYRAYIPIYNALGKAGWEPIPYARLSQPDMWCERFGGGQDGCYFAIRNPGAAREVVMKIDRKALGLTSNGFESITGCTVKSVDSNSVKLSLPATWTGVVSVGRADSTGLASAHRRELTQK